VLAVVVMGLYMNYNRASISPAVLHFLHEFYEMVAHVLNTVIFLIAGAKLGTSIADSSFHHLFFLGPNGNPHTRNMFILIYPIVLIARGAAVALAFPIIKRCGTSATWQEAVVMWWGGLRGSVRAKRPPMRACRRLNHRWCALHVCATLRAHHTLCAWLCVRGTLRAWTAGGAGARLVNLPHGLRRVDVGHLDYGGGRH
jgi:hypothetical protein